MAKTLRSLLSFTERLHILLSTVLLPLIVWIYDNAIIGTRFYPEVKRAVSYRLLV
jgi:hypothetical protein